MRYVRCLGLVLAGAGIAVALVNLGAPAQAQEQSGTRMRWTAAGNESGNRGVHFLSDTRSGGCWIVYETSAGLAMATAPPAACVGK